jgi:hypothetical protein
VKRRYSLSVLLWWFAVCTAAIAADAPQVMVQTQLQPPGPAVAGQQVRLVVTVLTTTWFLHAPEFPELTAPNAMITLPDEHPDNLNQTIGAQQWFGLSRAYLVTPSGAGDVAIPSFEITLWPGQASGAMSVTTQAITLPVKVVPRPAGAEHLLASSSVQVSQHLDRTLDGLKVGDAFTRTIEVTAANMQGMFIPPTNFPPINGLAVYPATGKVDNVIRDRMGFIGSQRSDAATYVIQQAGDYALPAVTLAWWNTSTGTAETAEVPALKFSAAVNPAYKPAFALPEQDAGAARKRINWYSIVALAAAAAALLWLLYALSRVLPRGWRRLQAWRAERQRRYQASERAAYQYFEQALQGGDARATYAALLAWAEHPQQPVPLRGLAALCNGHAAFKLQVDALRACAFGAPASSWQAQTLLQEVRSLREQQVARTRDCAALPPLNPA